MENKNFTLNMHTEPGFKLAKVMNKPKKGDEVNTFKRNGNEPMRRSQLDRGDQRNPSVKMEAHKPSSNLNKVPNGKQVLAKPRTPCKDRISPAIKAIQKPRQGAQSNEVRNVEHVQIIKNEQLTTSEIEKNRTDKIQRCTLILDAAIRKIVNDDAGTSTCARGFVDCTSKGGDNTHDVYRKMGRDSNLAEYTRKGADSKPDYISKDGGSKEKRTMVPDKNTFREKGITHYNNEKRNHEKLQTEKIVPRQPKRQTNKDTEITKKKEKFQEIATVSAVQAKERTENPHTDIRKSTIKTAKTKERKPAIKTIPPENNTLMKDIEKQNEPSRVQIRDRFGKSKTLKSQSMKLDSVDGDLLTIMQMLDNSDVDALQPKLKNKSKTKLKGIIPEMPMEETGLYHKMKKSESPEFPISLPSSPPMTEVAKWAPSCIDHHTKRYYEAWVDTTLTSRSKDRQNVEMELIRSLKKSLAERPQTPELVYADMNDERYTGRIRVRHRHM